MLFDKIKDGISGLLKAQIDRASGTYCTKHLGPESFRNVRWFRQTAKEDVLLAARLEESIAPLFSRKAAIFGKEVDLTYRIKKRGWQVLAESIIVDPAGRFLERVVNKSNLKHALSLWRLLYQIDPRYTPIDWHTDFHSDYRFDSTVHAHDINAVPRPGVHLASASSCARLYHLTWMALVYRVREKDAYAQEILCELLDFMSLNPPWFGIHWSAPEEVAVRTVNMVIALSSIREWLMRHPYGDECIREVLKYLYSCGEYLYAAQRGKEPESFSDLFALSALLVVSVFLEGVFEEARGWKSGTLEAFTQRIPRYVAPDGTNPEASTSLHRYSVEALACAVCFYCIQQGEEANKENIIKAFGGAFFNCFYKMCEVLFFLIKPNGTQPQIGDNPSLHFFKFNPSVTLQAYPLLYLCSALCEEPLWAIPDFLSREDAFADSAVFMGKDWALRTAAFNGAAVADIPSRAFSDSGWYLLRSRDNYCLVSAGSIGRSEHRCFSHNDKLAFEFCLRGDDIVVDPGSFNFYDPKERNAFRGTASHAALVVKGEEQNPFGSGMFSMAHRTRCKVLDFGEDEESIWFEAEQYGYRGSGFVQRRRIEFVKSKEELAVKDILVGTIGRVEYWNTLILSPSFDVLRLNMQAGAKIHIDESGWYSAEYGIKVPAKRIETSALSYTIGIIR